MNEQTDAAEAEALAEVFRERWLDPCESGNEADDRRDAELILASDWLAAREAAAEVRGAERALREAADAMGRAARDGGSHWRAHAWANWLRARAAQVAPSRVPGEES